jgi:hypothetical protein
MILNFPEFCDRDASPLLTPHSPRYRCFSGGDCWARGGGVAGRRGGGGGGVTAAGGGAGGLKLSGESAGILPRAASTSAGMSSSNQGESSPASGWMSETVGAGEEKRLSSPLENRVRSSMGSSSMSSSMSARSAAIGFSKSRKDRSPGEGSSAGGGATGAGADAGGSAATIPPSPSHRSEGMVSGSKSG